MLAGYDSNVVDCRLHVLKINSIKVLIIASKVYSNYPMYNLCQ